MKQQKGMTLIGMLLTVALIVMAAIVVMRIVPVFIQHYSIVHSIKALNGTPIESLSGDPMTDAIQLRASITKRLDINGIPDLTPQELVIVPNGPNDFLVKLKYKVVRPLVYNMNLLFDFNETIEVKAGSEH